MDGWMDGWMYMSVRPSVRPSARPKKNITYLYQQLLFAILRYPVCFEFGCTIRPEEICGYVQDFVNTVVQLEQVHTKFHLGIRHHFSYVFQR